MASIDLEKLLTPISDESPSGANLEYATGFGEMERAAAGRAEQQFGDTLVEAEEPDWRDLQKKCLALLEETKDLRVLLYLSRAALRTAGFAGFASCMSAIRGCIEQFWDSVHPQLDPDDDNDPMFRVNTISQLCDGETMMTSLRRAPLVRSAAFGEFSLRDIEAAENADEDSDGPKASTIEAAFLDADVEELQSTRAAIEQAADDVRGLEASLTEQVGAAQSTSLASLTHLLAELSRKIGDQLAMRGADNGAETTVEAGEDGEVGEHAVASNGHAGPKTLTGDIVSRDDVVKALDKVCEYYARNEPSSPLPLLINRAKRLATKNFMEIIRDLTPDAYSQVEALAGASEDFDE